MFLFSSRILFLLVYLLTSFFSFLMSILQIQALLIEFMVSVRPFNPGFLGNAAQPISSAGAQWAGILLRFTFFPNSRQNPGSLQQSPFLDGPNGDAVTPKVLSHHGTSSSVMPSNPGHSDSSSLIHDSPN